MLTRVIGVCLIVFSSFWLLINTFLYMNSSAFLDYNAAKLNMSQVKVFFPYMIFIILFIFGVLLVKDKEYDHGH